MVVVSAVAIVIALASVLTRAPAGNAPVLDLHLGSSQESLTEMVVKAVVVVTVVVAHRPPGTDLQVEITIEYPAVLTTITIATPRLALVEESTITITDTAQVDEVVQMRVP